MPVGWVYVASHICWPLRKSCNIWFVFFARHFYSNNFAKIAEQPPSRGHYQSPSFGRGFSRRLLLIEGCEKYELDRRMNKMCEKDGGLKIYETVKLPQEYFDKYVQVKTSTKKIDGEWVNIIADKYIAAEKSTTLKSGDPLKGEGSLDRIYTSIVRIEDKKILAESVQYLRAGGDGLYWGHYTQKACPNYPMELNNKVFIKQSGGVK